MPATLALTLGPPATFGAFTPGVARTYDATTTANVITTAGDAALTVSDPGHLTNGSFSSRAAAGLVQQVGLDRPGVQRPGDDRLQAGDQGHRRAAHRRYTKTLTFTLSTTTP